MKPSESCRQKLRLPLRVPLPGKLSLPRALRTAKAGCLKRSNAPFSQPGAARGSGCGASKLDCTTWCLTHSVLNVSLQFHETCSLVAGKHRAMGRPRRLRVSVTGRCRGALPSRGRLRCGSGAGISSSGAQIYADADASHHPPSLTCASSAFFSRRGWERSPCCHV